MKHHQLLIFFFIVIFLASTSQSAHTQTIEELKLELALLEAELDSVSLLGFIDSLISLGEPKSSISLGLGYSNQVLTNGQNLGIEQFGMNTNISYFHKSGFYGNYTGFLNSEITPKYYLNIVSLGYLNSYKNKFIYNLNYEKSFFSDESGKSLTNALNGSISFVRKNFRLSASYAYLFGQQSAHQLIPSISYNKSITKIGVFKSISFTPTFSLFFANPNIITSNLSSDFLKETWLVNQFTIERILLLNRINTRTGRSLLNTLNNSIFVVENNNFSLLNSSLSLPLTFQINDKLSFSATVSFIFAEDLNLGRVAIDPENRESFENEAPRFSNIFDELEKNIVFENISNSNYLNFTINYTFPLK